jgi:hypothetical protein
MKNSIFSSLFIALLPFICFSQSLKGIDYISPFHEGLAAIQKNQKWAFINTEGIIVINFRGDLVKTNFEDASYPVFINNRCLISEKKEGINYFGYIDTSGETVIKPQFLNAANFNNKNAVALNLIKDTVGYNNLFDKPVIRNGYIQVAIKSNGDILNYLTLKPKTFTLSSNVMEQPPEIKTKFLTDDVVAIWTEDNTWEIKKLTDLK